MRLATVISLLQLLACAASQLQPEERRDDSRSLVTPCRSFQPNSRRRLRLASRPSIIGPDIVPRGNPMLPPPSSILNELMRLKGEAGGVTPLLTRRNGNVRVYRLNFHLYFKGHVVVKEINPFGHSWDQKSLEKEVGGVRAANQLYGVLFNGRKYFILMKDMGEKWIRGSPTRFEATELMRQADERHEAIYFVKRAITRNVLNYTWTRRPDNTWHVEPVGSWRYAEHTGGESPVPKDRRYCGITEWDANGLPVLSMASSTDYYTG